MPIINLSSTGTTQTGATTDPTKYVPITGSWGVASFGNGFTVLTTTGGKAISELVQGKFLDNATNPLITPSSFGGITPNNDANQYAQVIPGQWGSTTTMPNQQAPLVNYLIAENTFIVEVISVIDDDNIVVKDPSGVTLLGGSYILIGASSNSYPVRNITITNEASSSCTLYTPGALGVLLGEGTTTFQPNSYGECAPIMLKNQSGTTILMYNE